MTAAPPLRIVRARDLDRLAEGPRWLLESLWPDPAVGIIGGQPKSWKSWLALDLALAVASATPCLGRFAVVRRGAALVYLAEDALHDVRVRLECLCASRRLDLEGLDLHVIAEPALRLDQERDRGRLREAIARLRPRLLVLDPLVRLHRLDENNSQEISELLGFLRELQRAHEVSIVLVHHTSKRAHARQGQSLRGSSDLHAWTDVGLYLAWRGDRLLLTAELRTAPAPDPVELRLITDDAASTHLAICGGSVTTPPATSLAQRILAHLEREAPLSIRRTTLREHLRINNAKLGDALTELERLGLIARSPDGWRPASRAFRSVRPQGARGTEHGTVMPGETDSSSAGTQLGKG